MHLASRGAVLVVLGLVLLFGLTPLAAVYAIDYQAAETRLPAGTSGDAQQYDSLDPTTQSIIDEAHEGSGRWYRTRSAAPVDLFPTVYERDRGIYRVHLTERYHWSSWRAAGPFLTGGAGLACLWVVAREQLRNRPGI